MDDLDALLKLLNRVKARGWTVALAQASEGKDRHKISVENYPPYSEPLITLRQEMEQARVCLKALEDIRCRLKQRLRALRRVSMPLVLEDGIKRLPDDLLAVIFEMGHNMAITGGRQFSLDVSHVSRRLRRISLQTPLLWTRIKESYSESQIREFISRSGQRDLDIGIFTASRIPSSRTEVFLQLVGEYSHRWSSINTVDMTSESMMTKIGITSLPRLRYVSHTYDVSFSTWSTPALAHVEGWSCLLPAGSSILMQLTHFELNLSEDAVDIQDLAVVLHDMRNLQDLSLDLEYCKLAEDAILSLDATAFPKPRSVHIDKLTISIYGTKLEYSALLFDALMHLRPSTVELSLWDNDAANFLRNSKHQVFPYGSTVKLNISKHISVLDTLVDLVKSCDIVRTVQFDTLLAYAPLQWGMPQFGVKEWEQLRCLNHIQFKNCDGFTERTVEEFAKGLLNARMQSKLKSLEILSCKNISEDFLLELRDEVGDRLKWTL